MQNFTCVCCGATLINHMDSVFDSRFGIAQSYCITMCENCGLVQTAPLPDSIELKALYERYYNFGGEKGTRYTRLRQIFQSSDLSRVWAFIDGDISFLGRGGAGRLLDVGCNEGRGLDTFKSNGFSPEGLEMNERAADVAREKGFLVCSEPIENFNPEKPFDVIVLSNVLEHALSPGEMLRHVGRLLKSGGRVWISCPNVQSWQHFFFGKSWINWHVPFHVVHFSPDTLRRLLTETGFHVVESRQASPALWMASSMIASVFSKPGKSTRQLRNPFLVAGLMLLCRGLLFPVLMIGNLIGRGDCLIVVAEKQ